MAMAALEDDDDMWAVTTSPSASPPATAAAAAISTALSLNSRLHLLASSSPFHPGFGVGGCSRNAAAAPPPCFFSAAASSSFPHFAAPLDGAGRALERGMCGLAQPPAWSGAAPAGVGVVGAGASGCGGPVERRKKRMIKNRESASRSRARKQAHVTQLESEVRELQRENDDLRVKYEQLKASAEAPVPVKRTLKRVLSAPF